jgi:AcrR family transcriptional regulator
MARPARRLDPEARREQILAAAVCYFAEVGFGGTTRDLAQRIGITQALLYRYFASKEALVEAVFERIFLGRLRPNWAPDLRDRALPLPERMRRFYRDYAGIFTYEWIRIFMWAGLAGEALNQRYISRVGKLLLEPMRDEIAADPAYRTPEMEEIWALHGGVVYRAIRRHIYRLPTPGDDAELAAQAVDRFLAALRRDATPPAASPGAPSPAAAASSRAARPSAGRSGRASPRR